MNPFFKHNPSDITVSDLAMDSSFIRWVRESDPQADEFWQAWLERNPEMKDKVEAARLLVLSLEFHGDNLHDNQVDAEWEKLRRHSGLPSVTAEKGFLGIRWKGFMSVAAAVLLLVAAGAVSYLLVSQYNQEDFITSVATPGQKLSITLSDGTNIKLNSGSKIRYPSRFTGDAREVTLEGEAFFKVAHNAKVPFKVHTDDITVVVLGTSFNVDAYPENENVRVALEEGKVKINVKGDANTDGDIFLSPSELFNINKKTLDYEVQPYDPLETSGWKDGYLHLGQAGFRETMVKLERWFGVKFEIDSSLYVDPGWRFAGKFQDKSLPYILNTLRYPDLFQYKIEDEKVIIY